MICLSSYFHSVLSAFSDDTATLLNTALSKHVYPVLDTLPEAQAQAIVVALQDAQKDIKSTKDLVLKIDFAARKQTFESDLRTAEHSQGLSVWTELRSRHTGSVRDWIPLLWQVGVEKGLSRGLVRECLSFCEEVDHRLVPPQAIAQEWAPREFMLTIQNTSGDLALRLEKCNLKHAIACMWLELLTSCRAGNNPKDQQLLDEVLLDHMRASRSSELLRQMVEAHCNNEGDYESIYVGQTVIRYGQGHWSPSRKQALTRLRELLYAPLIQAFRTSPTYTSFQALVADAPSLLLTLLEVTRSRVHDNIRSRVPRIQWECAARIYVKWGTVDDLLRLDCTLADIPADPSVFSARLTLFQRIAKEPGMSTDAVWIGKKLLKHAVVSCWHQIAEEYPGWDDAWDWLDATIRDGQVPKKSMPDAADKVIWKLTAELQEEFTTRLRTPADHAAVAVPTTMAKRRNSGYKDGQWGPAHDVRRCLTAFKQCRMTARPVKEQIDADLVVQHALGNDYLATVDGVVDGLYDGIFPDPFLLTALNALRGILLGTWETGP